MVVMVKIRASLITLTMYASLEAKRVHEVPEVCSFSALWSEVSPHSGLVKSPLASAPISRGGEGGESIDSPDLCYAIQTAPSTSGNNYRTGKQLNRVEKCKCGHRHTQHVCCSENIVLEKIQWL